jgi:hypothetical protein
MRCLTTGARGAAFPQLSPVLEGSNVKKSKKKNGITATPAQVDGAHPVLHTWPKLALLFN